MIGKYRRNVKQWGLVILVLAVTALFWYYLGKDIRTLCSKQVGGVKQLFREVVSDKDSVMDIEKVKYHKEGVEASYPRILSGGDVDSLERWNKLIKRDFDKMIRIYSLQPFPGPTPSSTDVVPIILTITYEVTGNSDTWLSLVYHADYNSSYSAHPSNLIYTTNIDKEGDRRLRLRNIAILNEAFVKEFRTWKLRDNSEQTKEVQDAIYDYIEHISDEDLLEGFRAADQIGSGNPWGIYSYLTKDSIGISIEVPNYAGDHAEFEQSLASLGTKGLLRRKCNHR